MNINPVGRTYASPLAGSEAAREARAAQIQEKLELASPRSQRLNAEQLAAYRSYAGELSADVQAVTTAHPEPTPAVPASGTSETENFSLSEAADPNSTPRYQPEQRFREQALQECQAAPGFAPRSQEAQAAVLTMVSRLLQIQESSNGKGTKLEVDGVTPVRMFLVEFVNNQKVTDEMLIKMGKVELKDLARTPEEQKDIEERMPGSRELITHKMAVALLSAMTGIPPEILSQQCPDLGLSGTPDYWLWEPGTEGCGQEKEDFELANILHDTTDFLKDAGVDGLNRAVWGDESSEGSAWNSWWESIEGDRYAEET
jgi:hypothetical protein